MRPAIKVTLWQHNVLTSSVIEKQTSITEKVCALDDLHYYRHTIEYSTGVPFFDHNDVVILQNGDEIFPAMLKALDGASKTVDFLTFVYWKGEIAEQFAKLLAKKSKQGLKVRVLLDAFGAKLIEAVHISLMEEAGVEVRWFRPLANWRFWRIDKRTHRKILICDNRIGFTGGVGIAQQWTGNARNENEWRDTHVKITGPALLGLRAAFLDNWNESGDWLFESLPNCAVNQQGDIPVQVLRASNTTGWTDIAGLIRCLIALSQKSVHIVTAYFVPDRVLIDLLIAAHARGVEVNLLLPGDQTDSRFSQLAGNNSIEELLKAGINIWKYQKTLLHAKIILVDGCVSCVGSANINHRSMGKDEECCVVTLSKTHTLALMEQFKADCRDSEKLSHEDWLNRSMFLKIKEWVARHFSEQL